jgi:hypothetical protein
VNGGHDAIAAAERCRGRATTRAPRLLAAGLAIPESRAMQPTIVKPVADPLDDIDRVTPVDTLMARQDRADLPGNRSDQPGNDENDPDRNELGADPDGPTADADAQDAIDVDVEDLSTDDVDPDIGMAVDGLAAQAPGNGPDDDEPIEETERLGDDSLTGPG